MKISKMFCTLTFLMIMIIFGMPLATLATQKTNKRQEIVEQQSFDINNVDDKVRKLIISSSLGCVLGIFVGGTIGYSIGEFQSGLGGYSFFPSDKQMNRCLIGAVTGGIIFGLIGATIGNSLSISKPLPDIFLGKTPGEIDEYITTYKNEHHGK